MSDCVNWHEYLSYDPDTGVLSWKQKRPGPVGDIGDEVGSVKSDGRYRSFVIFHKRYYTHRVVWEMVNGPIPDGMCIDHIDGNGLNNRLANLRLTTLSGNQRNRRLHKSNKTGFPGVYPAKKHGFNVYCAGKYIGTYQDLEAAGAARKQAEIQLGYHPNNGRK